MKEVSFILKLILLVLTITACSSKVADTTKARHKSTMRSYTTLGKTYYPKSVKVGDRMIGISSWYGTKFHGKQTSNGETYNMYTFTAAHKTWPMDTKVRVTNLVNKKSVIVRINDRGPFVKGRIIDCSYKAGKVLGLDKMGIAKVKLEVLGVGQQTRLASIEKGNFVLQIGSFSSYDRAKYFSKTSNKKFNNKATVKKFFDVTGKRLYRVFLVGFGSKQEAYSFKEKHNLNSALIVKA